MDTTRRYHILIASIPTISLFTPVCDALRGHLQLEEPADELDETDPEASTFCVLRGILLV